MGQQERAPALRPRRLLLPALSPCPRGCSAAELLLSSRTALRPAARKRAWALGVLCAGERPLPTKRPARESRLSQQLMYDRIPHLRDQWETGDAWAKWEEQGTPMPAREGVLTGHLPASLAFISFVASMEKESLPRWSMKSSKHRNGISPHVCKKEQEPFSKDMPVPALKPPL